MMCILHRFIFIIIYLLLIVASSCVLEWILLYENGFASYQIVEPLRNLSVSQLQAILTNRGIEYSNYLEKWELIDSLQLSGKVHYEELLEALSSQESYGPKEIFGKDEYYEQVLEEGESIWVIEVIPNDGNYSDKRILDSDSWKRLEEKLKSVGIQSAVIRCKNDPILCKRQDWNHPQLVLVVPKPHMNSKISIKLASTTRLSINAVTSWIRNELTKLIPSVDSVKDLQEEWLNTTAVKESKVPHMIYFSEMLNPPLLLVAIGLRFSSRIRLTLFNTRRFDKDTVSKTISSYKLQNPPQLVVTSSESVSVYGEKQGEYLTTTSLDFYIRLMKPKMNDLFLVSLIVTNFLAFLDFIDYRRSLWKHVVRTLCSVPVYNVFIFISWLTLSAVIKFAWLKPIIDNGSSFIYDIGYVGIPSVVLYYIVLIDRFKSLAVISSFLCSVLVWLWRKFLSDPSNDFDQDVDNWYAIFPMDSYLVNVLFRPMASLSRPRPSNELDLEEGMERLIQRLATPDLWLHPVIPTEYMQDLPTWRYDGWGNEDDLKSESETDFDSLSETENDSLLETHTCCQDESCKMCTLWATVKETYVCHRCAILKRKLEKKYLKCRNTGDMLYQNITYEKLLKVCENCSRTRRSHANLQTKSSNNYLGQDKSKRQWLITAQRLHSLKWTAPIHAIESRVCAICLDRYRWSAVLCGLPCGHTYHHSCIMEWLSKDNHQCPTCRWPSYKTKVVGS